MTKFTFLLIFLLLFSACENEDKNAGKIGFKASEISATSLKNEPVRLKDFKERIKIIIFFQKGCAACLKEMPLFDMFLSKHKGQIVALAIDSVDNKEVISSLYSELGIQNIHFLKDDLDTSWARYKVFALPTTLIIKDDIIKERIVGDKPWEFIESKISSLL